MSDFKEKHLTQANKFLVKLSKYTDTLFNKSIIQKLETISSSLQDLKSQQYYFDSNEKDLDHLYNQYLPLLTNIIDDYVRLQDTKDYEKIAILTTKILDMSDKVNVVINAIKDVLPEDEIMESKAMAESKKALDKLKNK